MSDNKGESANRFSRMGLQPVPLTEVQIMELKRCAYDPAYFLSTYAYLLDPVNGRMPFKLYGFQKEVLDTWLKELNTIVLKSRQQGISWLMAGYALWMALFFSNKNILMISIKQGMAKRLLDKVKFMFDWLPDWMRQPCIEDSKSVFQVKNGGRVESIPTSEEAGRSEGVSLLIIDEAAFVRWIDSIWQAAAPTLSMGGQAILASTPNGAAGFFYKTWMDSLSGGNGFKPVLIPWWKNPVYARGLCKKEIITPDGKKRLKWWSPWYGEQLKRLGWRRCAQEIECDFLASGSTFFDTEVMKQRFDELSNGAKKFKTRWMDELRIYRKPKPDSHYVLGLDTATGHGEDHSAVSIRDFHTWEQVACYKTQLPVSIFSQKVYELAELFNYAYIVGEENGVSLATLLHLRDSLHYPEDRIHHDTAVQDKSTSRDVIGWCNNVKSRTVYLRQYEELIRTQPGTFSDSRLVQEILTFIISDRGKPEAMKGYNDDIIFADVSALIGLIHFSPFGGLPFKVG